MKRVRSKALIALVALFMSLTCLSGLAAADGGVTLYTPYASISVPPGESIDYSIDVINSTADIQTVDLSVSGMPDQWDYKLTAGGRNVDRISVKPKESQSISLNVNVPIQVIKGTYHFQVTAGSAALPLTVNISETGTYKTELVTGQPNMEGHADSTFNYSTTLKNQTASKQLFALKAEAPQGWDVKFNADGKDVTSVNMDEGASKDISITVTPPDKVQAGSYKIPVTASAGSSSAKTELEAVVTGTYAIDLSTSSGNLSSDVTAGGTKSITLKVTNKGTSALNDVDMSASTPTNWEVTFEPSKIKTIAPGQSTEVIAQVKADGKAIAGDYVVSMTAHTAEKSADAQIRMTVKTSVLWGWIGILIILAVVYGVYYLFRTYGRR